MPPVDQPLLSVVGLTKTFFRRGRRGSAEVHALSNVSFDLNDGETLGLVGESGCGKSTLARCALRLIEPSSGEVFYRGQDLLAASRSELRHLRRHMQIVFQDSAGSLDPRMRVSSILAEPAIIRGDPRRQARAQVGELLEMVGLAPELARRLPHELSGGERQRIGLARALAHGPDLVFLDEAVSALDVSAQAGVLALLARLRQQALRSYVLISHDLSVVRCAADRVAVMYAGRIVEIGGREEIYRRPGHPYTRALLSAIPTPAPASRPAPVVLEGDVPGPSALPSGCVFRSRCWKAQDVCATREPALVELGPRHVAACHFPEAPPP